MAFLPSVIRKHYISTAIQYCRLVGGRKIHRRKCPGGGGQQLRDNPYIHCICLWLQHRLFRHHLKIFRSKELHGYEVIHIHSHDSQCRNLHGPYALRASGRRCPVKYDKYSGKAFLRFQAVSGHLHTGTSVCFLL